MELLVRVSLEISIIFYLTIMYYLWRDTGSAKTAETRAEAVVAIAARRTKRRVKRQKRVERQLRRWNLLPPH